MLRIVGGVYGPTERRVKPARPARRRRAIPPALRYTCCIPGSKIASAMNRTLLGIVLALLAAGCWSDDRTPARQRQEAALRDPFNYSPYQNDRRHDVSGGGIMHFDKEAFKRDVNTVLNP